MSKNLSVFSWNVRGLGQSNRRDDHVLLELISVRRTIAALQETKLTSLSMIRTSSFLPARLKNCVTRDSTGASGGILTAWDDTTCRMDATTQRAFTLTARLSLLCDDTAFTFTKFYAPANHEDKQAFYYELAKVAATVSGPWAILGDFNLIRAPEDKNNDLFNASEAKCFNDLINSIGFIEIP
jgi:exonuclease III